MYTILYGKFFFLKKLRLIYLKLFFIVFKLFLLFIFWSFIFIFILIFLVILYKITKIYINTLFSVNGYLNTPQHINKEISKKEINSYKISYSEEEAVEEAISKSTEFFIDNPNNEEVELIDDFYEIFINTGNINYDIIFSNYLNEDNNLIEGAAFFENEAGELEISDKTL